MSGGWGTGGWGVMAWGGETVDAFAGSVLISGGGTIVVTGVAGVPQGGPVTVSGGGEITVVGFAFIPASPPSPSPGTGRSSTFARGAGHSTRVLVDAGRSAPHAR